MSVLTNPQSGLARGMRPSRSRLQPAQRARPRAGWHAYRPYGAAEIPDWTAELALTIEFSSFADRCGGVISSALLLVRPSSRWRPLTESIGTAVAEVEALAGISTGTPQLRLAHADPVPGLEPVRALDVLGLLHQAARRGCDGGVDDRVVSGEQLGSGTARWQAGAGAVLACESPSGWSAQAVVHLDGHGDDGHGDPQAVRPPGPGAVVLRARRLDSSRGALARAIETRASARWALALGVVLAARSGQGLGRAARSYAADAERSGWSATVLTGPTALELAIAGDPRNPFPKAAPRTVGSDPLASLVNVCLASGTARVALAGSAFANSLPVPVDNHPGGVAKGYHRQTEAIECKSRL